MEYTGQYLENHQINQHAPECYEVIARERRHVEDSRPPIGKCPSCD